MIERCPESLHWWGDEHDCREALRLPEALLDAMLAHAVLEWPIEACGVLVGRPPTWHQRGAFEDVETEGGPLRHVPMRNVAEAERYYSVDPRDQLELEAELAQTGEAIRVVYHSHTHSGSTASGVDEAYARQADAFYLILAVRNTDGAGPVFQELTAYACDGSGLVERDVIIEMGPRGTHGPVEAWAASKAK